MHLEYSSSFFLMAFNVKSISNQTWLTCTAIGLALKMEFPLEGVLLLNRRISPVFIPTSPACCPSLGRIWGFWLPLNSEGVEATGNIQWPWTANNGHTHTYCYALAPSCTSLHPSFLLWTSTDGLLSSLTVLGVCCGLAGLQTTTGNCTVFPLPDSKPSDSQQLHSLATFFTWLSTILGILFCFCHSRWDGSVGFRCCFWICFHSVQKKQKKQSSVGACGSH